MVNVKKAETSNRISVKSTKETNVFGIKDNLSEYYAKLSERWASSESLVNGIDYSSKYYAEQSRSHEEAVDGIKTEIQVLVEGFDNEVKIAKDNIEQNRVDSVTAINNIYSFITEDMRAKSDETLATIQTKSDETLVAILAKSNEGVENIENEANNAISEITEESQKQIANIKSTGFYVRDDKLYFIDSNGEEKEFSGGGGLEIGDIGFTQMAIDETKGKRRILNGQLIIQEQYTQFTEIVKNSVALNPDLACTESEWQTAVTMSTDGVCYKFVIDDEAGTIRLPKYPQYLMKNFSLASSTASVAIKGNGVQPRFAYSSATGTQYNAVTAGADLQGSRAIGIANSANTGDNIAVYFSNSTTYSGLTGTATLPKLNGEGVVKGQYFIQVATGAETEDNIINEIELNNPFSLLDYKYSEYELNNLSWLRSNGQYNSKAVYPAVYELLLKIYNGVETKAGVSVKLSTETFADTDFVLNTANETFRLPLKVKQKFFNSGDVAVVGNGLSLGLTTGNALGVATVSNTGVSNYVNNLAFLQNWERASVGTSGASPSTNTNLQNLTIGVDTNPSRSGLVAKLSNLEATGLYLYFYVGETVQNANLINAGRIEEVVSQIKADKLDKSAVKAYIVESYINGTSWYNRYSNGWIEQGGRIVINSASVGGGTYNNTTLTFIKPFSKLMSWHCQAHHDRFNAGFSANVGGAVSSVNVYQVNDSTGSFSNAFVLWEAKGYIA